MRTSETFRKIVIVLGLVALMAAPLFAEGQAEDDAGEYPTRPVTFMVPYGTGGGTDVTARLLADPLQDELGVTVTVQNITGGGGWNGWGRLASEDPDGYFVGYTNIPNMYSGYLDPQLNRDESLESFDPIILHVVDPCVWAVRPDSQFQSIEDVIEYAQDNALSVTAHGFGGDDHLAILRMQQLTGLEFNVVHNDSTANSITQVLAGDVQILGANLGEVKTRVENGELRALGLMWESRSDFLPDLPTFQEQGYDVVMFAGRMISGPAGMAQERKDIMADAIKAAVEEPNSRDRMNNLGLTLDLRTGEPLMEFAKKNEQMVKELMGW